VIVFAVLLLAGCVCVYVLLASLSYVSGSFQLGFVF
jgi:hypothetical protein